MPSQDDAYLRHQQMRLLRGDAHRWVRPDAARWYAPGTKLEDIFPALALKYNPNQPRVPSGNPDGGQWTDADGGWGDAQAQTDAAKPTRPRVIIDTTHLGQPLSEAERAENRRPQPVFHEAAGARPARRSARGGSLARHRRQWRPAARRAAKNSKQKARARRRNEIRSRCSALDREGRAIFFLADAFFSAADQVEEINRYTDMIKTANDLPRSLRELRDRAQRDSERGYEDHHIVGQHRQNRTQFGDAKIDSSENLARVPVWKHIELNRWYSRTNQEFGGLAPRDALRGKSWEEQMNVGHKIMQDLGIMK